AISLMNEILVAKNAFDAYLIISAVRRSVIITRQRSVRYSCATVSAAWRSVDPSTTRSGCMKSISALPSRRNSGLETTAKVTSGDRYFSTMADTQSPAPIGTVLLLMMIVWPERERAMRCAQDRTARRSARSDPGYVAVLTAM